MAVRSAGIIRVQDGRYLLVLSLGETLDFYLSRSSDIRESNWIQWDTWHYTELNPSGIDTKWLLECDFLRELYYRQRGYQNVDLVTDCESGEIYLIASHGRCPFHLAGGDDFVDAYRVFVPLDRPAENANYAEFGIGVEITKVAKRRMHPEMTISREIYRLQAGHILTLTTNYISMLQSMVGMDRETQ